MHLRFKRRRLHRHKLLALVHVAGRLLRHTESFVMSELTRHPLVLPLFASIDEHKCVRLQELNTRSGYFEPLRVSLDDQDLLTGSQDILDLLQLPGSSTDYAAAGRFRWVLNPFSSTRRAEIASQSQTSDLPAQKPYATRSATGLLL